MVAVTPELHAQALGDTAWPGPDVESGPGHPHSKP